MREVTVRHIDDMHSGEHGGPKKYLDLSGTLGVSGCDLRIIKMTPNSSDFPKEANAGDSVYVVLEGDAVLHTGNGTTGLDPSVFVRVGPSVEHTIVPGDVGATILAIGAPH
jgi:hypothetical protein